MKSSSLYVSIAKYAIFQFLAVLWLIPCGAETPVTNSISNKGSILMVTACWAPNVPYRHRYYEQ
ncbi:MAG: hypothetical protein KKD76_02385, partial [Verrucomicrobia bacterium]|nr:hypothetical protein [Verrucomicrobiota bacterium]